MTKEEIQLCMKTLQDSFNATNKKLAAVRTEFVEAEKRYRELVRVVEVFRAECSQLLLVMKAQAYAADDAPPSEPPQLPGGQP